MKGILVTVQLVGTTQDGTPFNAVQQDLIVNPEGPALASFGPVHLPEGFYRINAAVPVLSVPPPAVSAADIVDELARRLCEEIHVYPEDE